MAHDLRKKRVQMPVIPSSATVRKRLGEVLADAKKLEVLLRLATELEQIDTTTPESTEVANG